MLNLFFVLANRVGLIIMLSFVFSRAKAFRSVFLPKEKLEIKDQIAMALVFGGLGILSSYTGIIFKDAIVNTRAIGVVVGGLLGGPLVGILAGLIAGVHRFLMDPTGWTSLSCAISTLLGGTVAGLLHYKFLKSNNKPLFAWATGSVVEIMQMLIIIAIAKPFDDAVNLVSIIGMSMIIMNAIGIAIFITIVLNIKTLQDYEAAYRAQQTLKIADKTLQYFRQGLTDDGAIAVTEIIQEMSDFKAAAITDNKSVLGSAGHKANHARKGQAIETDMTKHVLKTGKFLVNQNTETSEQCMEGMNFKSTIIVPLKIKQETIGTLKLYKSKENDITIVDEEVAIGLGNLFSTQLELSEIDKETRLREKAELKALQAQINPHFLFNAINTIVSLIRTAPDEARGLLIDLGDYFRNNLQIRKEFIGIKDEIKHIEAYLKIEKARFGDKLEVNWDIKEDINYKIPPLLIQPIVENAVKHGVLPKADGGIVNIEVSQEQACSKIKIIDNGVGMSDAVRDEAVGLQNVESRLKAVYGNKYTFHIESKENLGTVVTIGFPIEGGHND